MIREKVPYGRSVVKIECTNHLVKNVQKKLHKLAEENSGNRKYLKKRITIMSKFTRWVITCNSQESTTSTVNLQSDLRAVPRHAFGDHTSCRPVTCELSSTMESAEYAFLPKPLIIQMDGIMNSLIGNASSLIENDTSNLAEGFMHIVAKMTGGKQCFYGQRNSFAWRTFGAGLSFQFGDFWHSRAWKEKLGHSPGLVLKRLSQKRSRRKVLSKRYFTYFLDFYLFIERFAFEEATY